MSNLYHENFKYDGRDTIFAYWSILFDVIFYVVSCQVPIVQMNCKEGGII